MSSDQDVHVMLKIAVEEIKALRERIAVLEEKLSRYEHPKNSGNSSKPPSQDPFRVKRTESLREKSGKKQGGQPGRHGVTLTFSENPDTVIEHKSCFCSVCGGDLSAVEAVFEGKHQV